MFDVEDVQQICCGRPFILGLIFAAVSLSSSSSYFLPFHHQSVELFVVGLAAAFAAVLHFYAGVSASSDLFQRRHFIILSSIPSVGSGGFGRRIGRIFVVL